MSTFHYYIPGEAVEMYVYPNGARRVIMDDGPDHPERYAVYDLPLGWTNDLGLPPEKIYMVAADGTKA